MTHARQALALAILMAVILTTSQAQTGQTIDPTRPPNAWFTAIAPATSINEISPEIDPLGVQILVIGATRRFAVIDGNLMHVGQTHQGTKLLAISAQSVRIGRDGTTVELRLTPNVRKKTHVPNPVPAGPAPARKVINGEIQ